MKVLVVSHNVICNYSNMGKTLGNYFRQFSRDELAQLYIHSEVPVDKSVCLRYYRITDTDAVRSLFTGRCRGVSFSEDDIRCDIRPEKLGSGVTRKAYEIGRRGTGLVHIARDLVWRHSRWFSPELRQWLEDFGPDVVFFASGDYAFTYILAETIADCLGKPLVLSCVDDYYLNNYNAAHFWGRLEFRARMKTVRRVLGKTACIFSICDHMTRAYEREFHIPCHTLHTPAEGKVLALSPAAEQISYLGNLDHGRHLPLLDIGRTLKAMDFGPRRVDVYSAETDPQILRLLTEENGIRFHGCIPPEEVDRVMENSLAVIHTEPFEPRLRELVRFSVSTKIAESLMYGPCLFAYGPEGIASMDYLRENAAAYVVTDPGRLSQGLREFLQDMELRSRILANARRLGRENHSMEKNSRMIRQVLREITGRE